MYQNKSRFAKVLGIASTVFSCDLYDLFRFPAHLDGYHFFQERCGYVQDIVHI